jgi:predicted nuclease of predicted toxin-antitoxin system
MAVTFLIDNALSPVVAELLRQAGFDAVHIRDYAMQSSPDPDVFDRADVEGRVLVSADSDFATILASRNVARPSLILLREPLSQSLPSQQATVLLMNLPTILPALAAGSVVTMRADRIRVRQLPLGGAAATRSSLQS